MPVRANIPREWIRRSTLNEQVIIFPSWSMRGGDYEITMTFENRQLRCNCDGFKFRGKCHHVAGLIWACHKKPRKRKDGIAETSMESYQALTKDDLGKRQCIVFEVLAAHPNRSNRELAELLNWPINTITPRIKELREMGAVARFGLKYDAVTNRNVMTWVTVVELDGG